MMPGKATMGQLSCSSYAHPSHRHKEGEQKPRLRGAKAKAQGSCPVPSGHRTKPQSCSWAGAIHSWEKLLPAARTETGLEPVPAASAAGLSFCLIGKTSACQPHTTRTPALCRLADSAAPDRHSPPQGSRFVGAAPLLSHSWGMGGEMQKSRLYLPLWGWAGSSCEKDSSVSEPGTIPEQIQQKVPPLPAGLSRDPSCQEPLLASRSPHLEGRGTSRRDGSVGKEL